MGHKLPKTAVGLQRQIERCVAASRRKFADVYSLVDHLRHLGPVALFGGALRGWTLDGAAHLPRDIDLVIDCDRVSALDDLLHRYEPRKNNFGGYRLQAGKWQVDLWPVSSTWAFRFGHAPGSRISDLPRTTFLNVDAIVFDLIEHRLYCHEQYIEALHAKVLDVNLVANPNPLGCIIRSLRLAALYDFHLGPRLIDYLVKNGERYSTEEIGTAAKGIFRHKVDTDIFFDLLRTLRTHSETTPLLPFYVHIKHWEQLALFSQPHLAESSQTIPAKRT